MSNHTLFYICIYKPKRDRNRHIHIERERERERKKENHHHQSFKAYKNNNTKKNPPSPKSSVAYKNRPFVVIHSLSHLLYLFFFLLFFLPHTRTTVIPFWNPFFIPKTTKTKTTKTNDERMNDER